jgi:hypothetical protein
MYRYDADNRAIVDENGTFVWSQIDSDLGEAFCSVAGLVQRVAELEAELRKARIHEAVLHARIQARSEHNGTHPYVAEIIYA